MKRNNRKLYESIMKDVVKTVKKRLNENSPYYVGAVTIKEILFGSFNDVMNNKGSIGRSGGGRTRNMVSIK